MPIPNLEAYKTKIIYQRRIDNFFIEIIEYRLKSSFETPTRWNFSIQDLTEESKVVDRDHDKKDSDPFHTMHLLKKITNLKQLQRVIDDPDSLYVK